MDLYYTDQKEAYVTNEKAIFPIKWKEPRGLVGVSCRSGSKAWRLEGSNGWAPNLKFKPSLQYLYLTQAR